MSVRLWFVAVMGLALLPSSTVAQIVFGESAAVLAAVEEQLVKVIASAEQSVVALGVIKRGAEAAALRVDGFGLEVVPRATDEHSPEFLPHEFGSGVIITANNSDEANTERLVLTAYHLVRIFILIPLAALLYRLFRRVAGAHVRFAPTPAE